MSPKTGRLHPRAITAALLLLGAACGGNEPTTPPIPSPGSTVRATVITTGGDPDIDGYFLQIGAVRIGIPPNGTTINSLEPGTYTVTLESVAQNCTVSGENPRRLTVPAGTRVDLVFEIVCLATGIELTTRTAGAEYAGNYLVVLNASSAGTIAPNAALVMTRLQPGSYSVELKLPGEHCRASGANPITVAVSLRAVTPVSFDLTCVAPARTAKIAYVSGSFISTVNPDGSGAGGLVAGHGPHWSPDGTQLVFSNTVCDYYGYICSGGIATINLETRAMKSLDNAKYGYSPAWAPAGDVIAFINEKSQLSLLTLSGGAVTVLPTPGVNWVDNPSWSPDGKRIVLECQSGRSGDLCVINKDGSQFVRLTADDLSHDSGPAWGPDGRIAFTRFIPVGSRLEIMVMATNGSIAKVTDGSAPAWSPDGSKLVFSGFNLATGRLTGLFSINADGTDRKQLTQGEHHSPAWRP